MAGRFPLFVVIQAVDKATGPLRRFTAGLRDRFKPLKEAAQYAQRLSRALGVPQVAQGMAEVGKATGRVLSELKAVALKISAIAAVGSLSIYGLAHSFAEAGASAARMSRILGVSTAWLQEMRYAAARASVPVDQLDEFLENLSRRSAEAAAGQGDAILAFQALGISVTDQTGRLRSLESLLPEVTDRLAALRSENIRNALAARMFGRSGPELNALLAEGSAGIDAMRARAHELGVVMDQEAIEASERFERAQVDLTAALQGTRNIIGGALLPVVTKLVEKFTDWLVKHRADIEAFAAKLAERLPKILHEIRDKLEALRDALRPLINLFIAVGNRVGWVNGFLAALAVLLGAKLILALAALGKAWAALNITIAVTPIGWILIGIAALVAAVWLLAKNWDSVRAWLAKIWESVRKAFGATVQWLVDAAEWLWDKMTWPFRKVGEFFSNLWDGIKEKFAAVSDWIMDKVRALTSWLPDWIKGKLGLADEDVQVQVVSSRIAQAAPVTSAAPGDKQEVGVTVRFENAPKGTRAQAERGGSVDVDLSMGYSMVTP